MQITREEKCHWGVWIGVALTFGWQLGTPYPLPSELQGDRVGKDNLLQNLHLDMRTGLSNAISPQPVSITLSRVRLDYKFRDYLQGTH